MPKYSQNFLIDETVLPQIIEAADLSSNDTVIEIGPGQGILTKKLCQQAGRVIGIEIDQDLMPGLLLLKNKYPHFEIYQGDFTTFNWQQLVLNQSYKIVANIPYHITGMIIRHIFRPTNHLPKQVVLMVQDAVAQKVIPKKKDHSVLSNLVRLFGQPRYIAKVDKSAFSPAPKVDSAIISIENIQIPRIDDFAQFFRLIKIGFASRRKTLLNNLSAGFKIDKQTAKNLLTQANIDPQRRAQTLSLKEWEELYYTVETQIANGKSQNRN